MKLQNFFRLVLGLMLSVLVTGCAGYHLGASKPKYMADIRTIAVPTFKNDTLEPRIEVLGAGTVIKQIQQDGTFIVAPEDTADAILRCNVLKIQRNPARSLHGNADVTREFELTIRIKYEVVRRTTKQVLDSRTIEGRTSFFVGHDLQQQERQAIPLALEDAAEGIVSILSEGW